MSSVEVMLHDSSEASQMHFLSGQREQHAGNKRPRIGIFLDRCCQSVITMVSLNLTLLNSFLSLRHHLLSLTTMCTTLQDCSFEAGCGIHSFRQGPPARTRRLYSERPINNCAQYMQLGPLTIDPNTCNWDHLRSESLSIDTEAVV